MGEGGLLTRSTTCIGPAEGKQPEREEVITRTFGDGGEKVAEIESRQSRAV